MGYEMTKVKLPNSNTLGLRVLLLDPNEDRGLRNQAILEEDPDLNRALIFTTSDLSEAKVWLMKQKFQLAIFPQQLGSKDFVSIQLELHRASPDIQMIPLIGTPSIQQLRESRNIGSIVDYSEENTIGDPKAIKELIFSFIRKQSSSSAPIKAALDYAHPIRKALTLTDPTEFKLKLKSAEILKLLLAYYEVDTSEVPQILAAECLYIPDMKADQYQTLLNPDTYLLLPMLRSTGSRQDTRPSSTVPGFLITVAHYLAEQIISNKSIAEIQSTIAKRPAFLKHAAIRTLTPEVITSLIAKAASSNVKTG